MIGNPALSGAEPAVMIGVAYRSRNSRLIHPRSAHGVSKKEGESMEVGGTAADRGGHCALGCAVACQVVPGDRGDVPERTQGKPELQAVAREELGSEFTGRMQPFLETYCVGCHSGSDASADLDLEVKDVGGMETKSTKLLKMVAKLSSGQMPPKSVDNQPKLQERGEAIAWLKGFILEQERLHAGDPGAVLAHRLSNAEYNYTIQDLTGVAIEPAKEFPVDPANQAGFDNSGESLVMDPELTKKYLEAARQVSEYLVFRSDGLAFARIRRWWRRIGINMP